MAREVAERVAGRAEEELGAEVADVLVHDDGELASVAVELDDHGEPGAAPDGALVLPLRSAGRELGRLVAVPSGRYVLDDGLITMLQQVADLTAREVAE